jgi:hypothetical protein
VIGFSGDKKENFVEVENHRVGKNCDKEKFICFFCGKNDRRSKGIFVRFSLRYILAAEFNYIFQNFSGFKIFVLHKKIRMKNVNFR